MDNQIIIEGKPVTLRFFTVKDKIDIDQLQRHSVLLDAQIKGLTNELDIVQKENERMDLMWKKYFKILTSGTSLSKEEIESLTGNKVDELLITVLEYNKPPLELQERLSTLSMPDSTQK